MLNVRSQSIQGKGARTGPPLAILARAQLAELVDIQRKLRGALGAFETGCVADERRGYALACAAHDQARRLLADLLGAPGGRP